MTTKAKSAPGHYTRSAFKTITKHLHFIVLSDAALGAYLVVAGGLLARWLWGML